MKFQTQNRFDQPKTHLEIEVSRDRSQRKQILQFYSLAFATVGCSHQKIRKILAEPNSAR